MRHFRWFLNIVCKPVFEYKCSSETEKHFYWTEMESEKNVLECTMEVKGKLLLAFNLM